MSSILYERDVENATNVAGSEPDWGKIVEFCNRVQNSVGASAMKGALLAIVKRTKHQEERVQLQALALLESCVSNCGKSFRAEMSDSQVLSDLGEVAKGGRYSGAVSGRMRGLLASWVAEFGQEPGFSAVRQLKDSLSAQGLQFPSAAARSGASSVPQSSSQRETDDLKRAIELSLQEQQPKAKAPSGSLYPSVGSAASKQSTWAPPKPTVKKCRALFDFEAAEDNELTFRSGETIEVLDDRDKHWWKGRTARGEGLFPSNFITLDLGVSKPESTKKTKLKTSVKSGKVTRVNGEVIDLCLDMLRSADATTTSKEEGSMLLELEGQCRQMRPLVEAKISSLEREEAALQDLNEEYQAAIALYRQLLSAGVPAQPQPTPFAASQPIHGAPPPTYQAPNPTYQPTGATNPTYQPTGAPNPAYQPTGAPNLAYQPVGGVAPTYQPLPTYNSVGSGGGGDLQQGAWGQVSGGGLYMQPTSQDLRGPASLGTHLY